MLYFPILQFSQQISVRYDFLNYMFYGQYPLGRPRRRWVDNIRMDLQEVGCGYVDWIGLAQDRQVADACECGNELSGSVKCGEFLD